MRNAHSLKTLRYMKTLLLRFLLSVALLLMQATNITAGGPISIQKFGVLPENTPQANREALQRAIDTAEKSGTALYVEPAEGGYRISSGIVLKRNVSLIGAHGPVGRGTRNPDKAEPTGSLFVITDNEKPFITVRSATQIRGIQFYYPEQAYSDPSKIIEYHPTIQVDKDENVEGVTLSCLTFYGEYTAMDFASTGKNVNEQILFEHCYGFPLSGRFITIDYCYDIPRVLHCHANPANMREFGRSFSPAVINSVVARKTFAYSIDHTDNAQLIDIFTFGTYGGILLGGDSYGQMTNFNFDCVAVGIHKRGNSNFNRNWQVAQGSIIANTGEDVKNIHPVIAEGKGHLALSNVEAFSGPNGALSTVGKSFDFILVKGAERTTVSMYGCRMRNYTSSSPLTVENPKACIQAVACIDNNEEPFNLLP